MPSGIYQHKKGGHWKIKDTSKYILAHKEGRASGFKIGNKINLGKQNRTGKHSEESIRKMKESQNRPEVRKRKSEWHITHPNRKFSNTKIEQKIAKELLKDGFYFKQNFGLDGIANVDFYLPDYNTVIECDGCYYHACSEHGHPKHHREALINDKRKTEALQKVGYDVYRFWGHEINKSAEECIGRMSLFKD